jgi:hypothetical protein
MTSSVPAHRSVGGWTDETESICARLVQDTGRNEAEVEMVVDRAIARFHGARVRDFVTLLAERDARRALCASCLDHVKATGLDPRGWRGTSEGERNGQDDG